MDFPKAAKGLVLVVPLSAALVRFEGREPLLQSEACRSCMSAHARLSIGGKPLRLTTRPKRGDLNVLTSPFAWLWCYTDATREAAVEGEPVRRRLAAILAADVAGYSRLIGEDEEGTI